MKKVFVCFLLFIFPMFCIRWLLNLLGNQIGKKIKVGFNIIYVDTLFLGDNVRIKSFNFIKVETLTMKDKSNINYFNIIKGSIDILMNEKAAIGKSNQISRGKKGVVYGRSILTLGVLSKLTANHYLDLTRSIYFGDYSTLAGVRSQIWTHGYVHADKGPERFRVDGEIFIGNNVYLGSNVFVNPGVTIADNIHIGGNSSISKDLLESGMYVNQGLRQLDLKYDNIKNKLNKIDDDFLIEDVYEK